MFSLSELRSSTLKELHMELETARRELMRVRIGLKTKHLKDSSLAGKSQRYVAQILTVLKEMPKEVKVAKEAAAPKQDAPSEFKAKKTVRKKAKTASKKKVS